MKELPQGHTWRDQSLKRGERNSHPPYLVGRREQRQVGRKGKQRREGTRKEVKEGQMRLRVWKWSKTTTKPRKSKTSRRHRWKPDRIMRRQGQSHFLTVGGGGGQRETEELERKELGGCEATRPISGEQACPRV